MPGINGRKLADEALARRPELKVLFTTGFTRNAVVHNGVLDPGVHFIAKPFTLEQLAAKVREVLDNLAAQRRASGIEFAEQVGGVVKSGRRATSASRPSSKRFSSSSTGIETMW